MIAVYAFGDIIAGTAPIAGHIMVEKINNKKIKEFANKYFGASLGVMAFQYLTLYNHPYRTIISIGIGLAGALGSERAYDKEKSRPRQNQAYCRAILGIAVLANAVLGVMSLLSGRYAYGLSAMVCTAYVILN